MNRKTLPIILLAASLVLSACASPSARIQTTTDGSSIAGQSQTSTSTASSSSQDTSPGDTASIETVTVAEYQALEQEKDAQILDLEETIDQLNSELDQYKKDQPITPDNSAIAFKQRPAGMLYFPVFGANPGEEADVKGYVAIKPQAEVPDKLDTLTQGISQILFANRPMEVVELRSEDGKQIVYVDLKDEDQWYQVFQGSTGGATASQSLILSYLQNDYRNAWIDGVHFTLDGQPIELEHAPALEETQYRD